MRSLARTFLVFFVGLMVFGCCNDDCPTCPEPEPPSSDHYSGIAYLSFNWGVDGLYIYDADSGEIVDSIMQDGGTTAADVSPDGKYLVVLYALTDFSETRIYDTKSKEVINTIPTAATYQFTDSGEFLIRARSGEFRKYQVPSFSLLATETFFDGYADFTLNAKTRSVFAVVDHYEVYQISYDSMKIINHWTPIDYRTDIPIFIQHFDIHPNGNVLYVNGSAGYNQLFVYNLEKDSLLASYPMYESLGEIGVTPDGGEVWVTDPGRVDIPFQPPDVGTIFIFDAYTGAHLGGISLYGYVEGSPQIALDAKRVTFSPDGVEAYVATGAIGPRENSGTILRFATHSRRLIDVIFPDIDRFPHGVVIGPKP